MDYNHPYDQSNDSNGNNNGQNVQQQYGYHTGTGNEQQDYTNYNQQAPIIAANPTSRPTYTPSTSSSSVPQYYGGTFQPPQPPSSTTGTGHTPSSGSNSPPIGGTHESSVGAASNYTESVAASDAQRQPTVQITRKPTASEVTRARHRNRDSEDVMGFDGGVPYDISGAEGFHPGHSTADLSTDIAASSPVVQLGASLFPPSAVASTATLVPPPPTSSQSTLQAEEPQPIQILRTSVENRAPSPFRGPEGQTSIALATVGILGAGAGYTGHVPPPRPLPTFDKDYNIVRKPSMAQRLMGGLGRMRTKRASAQSFEGNYSKLDEGDEDEEATPINMDVTSYQPDFIPASSNFSNAAGLLVPGHRRSSTSEGGGHDLSNYDTSYKGPMVDLSDDLSLYSRKTGFNQEIVIPVDKNPPNWKPHEMRLPYLMFLNFSNVAMLGSLVYLHKQSEDLGDKGLLSFRDLAKEVDVATYFMWKYLPTIVGVVYGILWELTDTEVKRVEPYYQMSRPEGAIAKNSLNVEYFSFWSFLAPVQAVRFTQWAVVVSASATVLAYAVVPVLLGALLNVEQKEDPRDKTKEINYLIIDPRYSIPLMVFLCIITILGGVLTVILWRRKSGLVGDVSGIAGIAAMANKSHILNDFHDLDEASEKAIHQHLSRRKYRIHKMSLYLGEVVDKAQQPVYEEPKFLMLFKRARGANPQPPLMTMAVGIPFIIFMMIVMVMMSCINYLKAAHQIVERFPFFATGLGILIKSVWEVLDKEMRVQQPFMDLAKGNARPETLTLDYTGTIPGIITFQALKRKHWLLALVTWQTVLVEVLTVGMGAFMNRYAQQEETVTSRVVSYTLAVAILTSMMLTMGIVLIKRRVPFLPRQPGTIASVLTFIHQSKMVTDFQNMEYWSTARREKKLVELNKRYGFGWFSGRDRQIHLGIDEEPMRAKYTHGRNYRTGVVADFRDIDHY